MNQYKVIITGDLHIGTYRTYNPEPDFRLNQFIKLAHKIVQVAEKTDSKEVWIAGDLLVTPKSNPKVMYFLKEFFNIIVRAGLVVRFVYGNHDLLIKRSETDIQEYKTSTLLSILHDGVNVFGYDQEVVEIAGKKCYFSSWRPNNEVPVMDADYLICHGDVKEKISPFISNYISTEPYERVISGHIHVPCDDDDDFISPASPIPHNFGDNQDTSLVIFDVANNTHHREYIHEDFLRFVYAKDKAEKSFIEESYSKRGQHVLVRIKKVKDDEGLTSDDVKDISMDALEINPRKVLHTFTDKLSSDSKLVIESVLLEASAEESELTTPDLRFDLKRLVASNFLSIRDIDFDFEDYHGLTAITGHNGSGKSTLFNLIQFMFKGSLKGYTKSDFTEVYKDKFSGTLELSYNGHEYKIQRGLSSLKFWEDGKLVDSNNKSDLQSELESRLKFIRFLNILYIKQESKGIFASMTDSNRISFLSKLIGLSLITKWTKLTNSRISDMEKSIESDERSILVSRTEIESIQKFIDDNSDHHELLDETPIISEIQSNKELLETYSSVRSELKSKIDRLKLELDSIDGKIKKKLDLESSITKTRELTDATKKKLVELTGSLSSISCDEGLLESLKSDYLKLSSDVTDLDDKIIELKTQLSRTQSDLDHLKSHPSVCPTCSQDWKIDNIDSRISELESEIDRINKQISNLNMLKSMTSSERDEVKSKMDDIETNKKLIKSMEDRITETESSLLQYKDLIEYKSSELKLLDSIEDKSSLESDISSTTVRWESMDPMITEVNSKIHELTQKLGTIELNNKIYYKVQESLTKIKELTGSIQLTEDKVKSTQSVIKELSKFTSKVLSDKGLLVATLLSKVAEHLNQDELLKVETVEELQNGSLKPNLNIRLYVKEYDQYLDYDKLSGGQRLQADLRFLSGITNSLGSISFMMLDELFKFFDDESIVEAADILKSMNVKKTFLIIHGGHQSAITNSIIEARLDKEKGSLYEKLT